MQACRGAHRGVAEHADVEVGVAQPGGSLLQRGDSAQHNLRIQVVRDGGNVLALNRQLHVEKRQVELQLRVPCREDQYIKAILLHLTH